VTLTTTLKVKVWLLYNNYNYYII